VESILAKPNYRHQKKQKEQARKLRQAEKQNRRLAARTEGDPATGAIGANGAGATATPEDAAASPAAVSPAQAGT
jgi:hypothetical protein